jgi:hypothetical protein
MHRYYVPVLDRLQKDTEATRLDANVRRALYVNNAIDLHLNKANFKADPTGNGRNTSNRSRRGVDNEGQLFTRDKERVEQWTHSLTRQQGIGIVVKEDE